jgi:arylformamidase
MVQSRGLQYFDISPEVSENTAVFPGDTPFRREIAMDIARGDHLGLSSIHSTVHIGAHTDAPNHYHRDGVSIDQRRLDPYLGACQVVSVSLPRGERIRPAHVSGVKWTAPRVLFRTGSFPDPTRWSSDFNSCSPELLERLADAGVVLVGIDTPSIDPEDSKALESHQAVYRRDLAILEGIVLAGVPDGEYTLVALPLRLKGADASPVRAVLLPKGAWAP